MMVQGMKFLWILTAVVVALCTLSPAVGAKMVSTSQAVGHVAADQDRARVQAFLNRTEARGKLQSLGIDPHAAKERVAGLTDHEAHELAQRLNTLPAGGDISNRNLIAILLVVVLVLLLI
jgi:hypothetical protein